ncbi:MAG: 4'-phosphopantetheinyl transferase superfamily protein [Sphingomicrobium sp.]
MTALIESWLFDLQPGASELADLMLLLSPDERLRLEQIRYARDKVRFASRRARLRQLIASCLDGSAKDLVFDQEEFGKPTVRGGGDISFSCSSSGDVGLCVVGRAVDVGCDIELRDSSKASIEIADRFFAPGERASLASLPANQWLEGFFNCWTRKEALLKCLGCGLSGPMDAYVVSLAPGVPACVLSHQGFAMASFRPLPPFHAAVVGGSTDAGRLVPRSWNDLALPGTMRGAACAPAMLRA